MEKDKIIKISLAFTAGILALGLIVVLVYMLTKPNRGKDHSQESSDTEMSSVSETEPVEDTTGEDPVVTTDEGTTQVSTGAPQTTDAESGVYFQDVNEQVTAKKEVNLRSSMNQGSDDNVVCSLKNGDIANRNGIGENGWSRVLYNGQTLYCISSYLTPDLSYVPPAEETDLFKTKFSPVNEKVTAKELTNLRDRPSVLEPSQVVAQLSHGEVVVRTGIANEGWSRVEYNGQILYCISSYLEIVTE